MRCALDVHRARAALALQVNGLTLPNLDLMLAAPLVNLRAQLNTYSACMTLQGGSVLVFLVGLMVVFS